MTRPSTAPVRLSRPWTIGAALVSIGLTAPSRSMAQASGSSVQPQGATAITPAEKARAELEHPRYTAGGVQFMAGMIGHHAQALVMAGWAPTHGASPAVRALADRITVSQTDEIKFMQDWLKDRHQAVPSDPTIKEDR